MGGAPAVGGGIEHQGYGTPHLHAEVHVACTYQYDTMEEVLAKLHSNRFSLGDWQRYQEWLHSEDVFDAGVKQDRAKNLEEDWHSRFQGLEHHDLSVNPSYLVEDAANPPVRTASDAMDVDAHAALIAEGAQFRKRYLADVQGQSPFPKCKQHGWVVCRHAITMYIMTI